jgi:hypothetical protein
MQKSQSKTFHSPEGDLEITITQLPAMRAFKFLARLGKGFGKPLAELLGKWKGSLEATDFAQLGPAVASLAESLSESEMESLTRALFETATIKQSGKLIPLMDVFDLVFQGRVEDIFKVWAFALSVNYGTFYNALSERGNPVQAKLESK